MKSDRLIERRFRELEEKAAEILGKKEYRDRYGGIDYYEVDSATFQGWATSVLNLLQRIFGEDSAHYRNFHAHYDGFRDTESEFKECMAIFQAAKEDYEGGYLFNVRALAKAEAIVDVLEQAEILKNANYIDTACILAGIALEIGVREICAQEGIPPGKFNNMNEQLRKTGVYNQARWEQLKTWYTRRSEPAHGNFGQSTPQDADEMIKGVRRFIADYL